MLRNSFLILSILCVSAMMLATQGAQTQAFPPVTDQMLANPSPDDSLMFSDCMSRRRCLQSSRADHGRKYRQ